MTAALTIFCLACRQHHPFDGPCTAKAKAPDGVIAPSDDDILTTIRRKTRAVLNAAEQDELDGLIDRLQRDREANRKRVARHRKAKKK